MRFGFGFALASVAVCSGPLGASAFGKSPSGWTIDTPLRGVHPANKAVYTASDQVQFRCLDGTKTIPFRAVNDDYCDCEDGSDEPGTSACPNSTFHCKNEKHIGADIPSSRVNDGICDPQCCDGSDEYLGIVKCQNNCMTVGAEARKEAHEKKHRTAQGEKIARSYTEAAAQRSNKRQVEITNLQRKVELGGERIQKLRDIKTAADEWVEKHKDEPVTEEPSKTTMEPKGKCCVTKAKCRGLLEEHIGYNLELTDRIEYLQEGAYSLDNVGDAAKDADVAARDAVNFYLDYKLMHSVPSLDDEEDESKTSAAAPEPEGTPVPPSDSSKPADCCSKLEQCRKEIDEEQHKFLNLHDKLELLTKVFEPLEDAKAKTKRDDEWVLRAYDQYNDYKLLYRGEKIPTIVDVEDMGISDDEDEGPVASDVTVTFGGATPAPEVKGEEEEHACDDPLTLVTRCLPSRASKLAMSLWDRVKMATSAGDAAAGAAGRHDAVQANLKLVAAETEQRELENKLAELRKIEDTDFGPSRVWEELHKQCFSLIVPEYTYEVCIHERAQQKPKNGGASTGLGTFTRWGPRDQKHETHETKYHHMMFENGDRCWNGPARSVEVTLECGTETRLVSVVEMSKCEYSAKLVSPAVCGVGELSVEEEGHSKDEL